MVKFAERLKGLREERAQLANALNTSVRTISYWETAQRECNFQTLVLIADLFQCSVDYLLGRTDY